MKLPRPSREGIRFVPPEARDKLNFDMCVNCNTVEHLLQWKTCYSYLIIIDSICCVSIFFFVLLSSKMHSVKCVKYISFKGLFVLLTTQVKAQDRMAVPRRFILCPFPDSVHLISVTCRNFCHHQLVLPLLEPYLNGIT